MSVALNQSGIVLQPCTVDCLAQLPDGTIVNATQVGTYQVNPENGQSELVLGSLQYLDGAGLPIPGATRAIDSPTLPDNRTWFSSSTGSPIYYMDGFFYNPDNSPYTGPTDGYAPASPSAPVSWPTKIYNSTVYAKINQTYIALQRTETSTYQGSTNPTIVVTFKLEGLPVDYSGPIVYALPEPVYKEETQIVRGDQASIAPDTSPISGFSAVWQVPLPTITRPVPSAVLVNGVRSIVSNGINLQSEAPLGTVIPPQVAVYGDAVAEVSYRLRVSPDIAEGGRALQLLIAQLPTVIIGEPTVSEMAT
jgi:hypothetical protein